MRLWQFMALLLLFALLATFATCERKPIEKQSWGKRTDAWASPDISHCWDLAEERQLWDCIRSAENE